MRSMVLAFMVRSGLSLALLGNPYPHPSVWQPSPWIPGMSVHERRLQVQAEYQGWLKMQMPPVTQKRMLEPRVLPAEPLISTPPSKPEKEQPRNEPITEPEPAEPEPEVVTEKEEVPFATPVPGREGIVYSPSGGPKDLVDVKGMESGTVVMDPTSGVKFRVP